MDNYTYESMILDDRTIFYNKDKWDNNEINIIFITGHSGSGKSTKASNISTESYSLDDVIEQYRFSDDNLHEYGDLIYSYFKGPGKKYRLSLKEMKDTTTEKTYEIPILETFINYAIKYANSHKNKRFCIEGIQLFQWFEPSRFKDYPVIILGTSSLKSIHRASKRDSSNIKIQKAKDYLNNEKYLKKWRSYFNNLMKDTIVKESIYNRIVDEIQSRYDSGIITYEYATKLNDLAYNKYVIESIMNESAQKSKLDKDFKKKSISDINYDGSYQLYHLSFNNLDGKILHPKIPDNFMTKNGYEENKTPRVSFSTSIEGCLSGLSMNLDNKELFVHVPEDIKSCDIYKVTKQGVPDCEITKEIWVTNNVKVKCIAKIKVTGSYGDGMKYTYGNGKSAELYKWKYKDIKKKGY